MPARRRWDLLTGDEVARFASYEQIRVATWMRNGNVAFGECRGAAVAPAGIGANIGPGNAQGNIILFEPSTSEHLSARTIFDPITALAPASDCRTFAIGYLNGSILIATLQPSFTILHTLTTPRQPSPIAGLAWHGSSSKQKSEERPKGATRQRCALCNPCPQSEGSKRTRSLLVCLVEEWKNRPVH
jgi:hypothetical protein